MISSVKNERKKETAKYTKKDRLSPDQFEIRSKPKTNNTVGIDVGLKSFLKTSDNHDEPNPRYFRENQAKLARLQRRQSRKRGSKKGETKSRRWLKLQRRINRLHNKIANQRDWFLHYISNKLVNNYDIIYSETLNVSGMLRNHYLGSSLESMGCFRFWQSS